MSARDRLLKAARDLFQRHGFHGVGLTEILEAAAATKGSLYHHFPGGKDELAATCVRAIADDVSAYIEAQAASGAGGLEITASIAEMCASRMRAASFDWSPLVSALGSLADPGRPHLAEALRQTYARWGGALAEAFRRKGLDDEEAKRAADLALLALEGAVIVTRATGDDRPLKLVGPTLERFMTGRG